MRERLNAIKALRQSARPPLRQADLAQKLGIDRSEISRYETGTQVPTLRMAVAIAQALRRPVEEVFYGVAEAEAPTRPDDLERK